MRQIGAACVAVGIVTILVGGCSSSSTTAPSNAPTQADAEVLAQGVESSIESSIASLIGGVQPILPSGSRTRSSPGLAYLRLAHIPLDLAHSRHISGGRPAIVVRDAPSCVSQVPASTTDEDSDGIPDTVTTTAAPNCQLSSTDSLTLTASGSIILGDPTPTTADANYTATVDNFVVGLTSGTNTASIALNGTADVSETTGMLTESNQLTLTLTASGADSLDASYAQNWMAMFTYTGSPLSGQSSLPAGSLSIAGTTNFTGDGKTFALAISTPTALTFDPSCATASQITAGTVKAVFSGTGGSTFVTLTWSGCQEPVVTLTSAS
jgi:hypothetical protein